MLQLLKTRILLLGSAFMALRKAKESVRQLEGTIKLIKELKKN